MCLESAAEALQVCSPDEKLRGAGGSRTEVTPHRPWRNQLCIKVSDGTLCVPPALQESRLPQTQHCLDAQSQPWTTTATELFVPPGTRFGVFPITWEIPKWHELIVWGFQLPYLFLWNTWRKLLSPVSSEGQGAPVITGLMLKLEPGVDTSLFYPLGLSAGCLRRHLSPVGKDKRSTVGCWLSKVCHPHLLEILCGLEEEVKACTASVFILTCL